LLYFKYLAARREKLPPHDIPHLALGMYLAALLHNSLTVSLLCLTKWAHW
jgi:hypothetical protein